MTGSPESGWYRDPAGGTGERYWTGEAWTEHVRDRSGPVHHDTTTVPRPDASPGPSAGDGDVARPPTPRPTGDDPPTGRRVRVLLAAAAVALTVGAAVVVVIALGDSGAPLGEVEVVRPPALQEPDTALASVSPTGSRLLVERADPSGSSELCVHEVNDATPISCVTADRAEIRADAAYLRWSPDEGRIALSEPLYAPFSHLLEGTMDVFLLDVDRGSLDNLTAAGLSGAGRADSGYSNYHMPAFAPDGRSLAALRQAPDGEVELVEIDVDDDRATWLASLDDLPVGLRVTWHDDIWLDAPRPIPSVTSAIVVDAQSGAQRRANVQVDDVVHGDPGRGEVIAISDDGAVVLLYLVAVHRSYYDNADLATFALLDTASGRTALVRPDVGPGTADPGSAFFDMDWAHLTADGEHVVFTYEHADGAAGAETRPGAGSTSLTVARAAVTSILEGGNDARVIVNDLRSASGMEAPQLISVRDPGSGMALPLPYDDGWLALPFRGEGEQVLVRVQVEGD